MLTNRLRPVDVQRPLTDEQLVVIGGTLESILAGHITPIRRCGKWRHQYMEVSEKKRKRQPPPTYASDVTSTKSTKKLSAKRARKKVPKEVDVPAVKPKGFTI